MKQVLLISNLDLQSPDVLQYVSEFCKYYSCKLHIVHFDEGVDPVLLTSAQSYTKLGLNMASYDRRTDLINKIKQEVSSFINTEWLNITIKSDRETWFIDKLISDTHLDLLIIGQSIFKKYHDRIGASIRDTITRHSMAPILVLPPLITFVPTNSINYLLKELNDTNLNHIIELANMFPQATIKLTHVVEKLSDELDTVATTRWMSYVKKVANDRITLQSESIAYTDYIKKENFGLIHLYDMLVFSTYNRKFWDRIIDPSTTLRQLSDLQIPALIFKHQK